MRLICAEDCEVARGEAVMEPLLRNDDLECAAASEPRDLAKAWSIQVVIADRSQRLANDVLTILARGDSCLDVDIGIEVESELMAIRDEMRRQAKGVIFVGARDTLADPSVCHEHEMSKRLDERPFTVDPNFEKALPKIAPSALDRRRPGRLDPRPDFLQAADVIGEEVCGGEGRGLTCRERWRDLDAIQVEWFSRRRPRVQTLIGHGRREYLASGSRAPRPRLLHAGVRADQDSADCAPRSSSQAMTFCRRVPKLRATSRGVPWV